MKNSNQNKKKVPMLISVSVTSIDVLRKILGMKPRKNLKVRAI